MSSRWPPVASSTSTPSSPNASTPPSSRLAITGRSFVAGVIRGLGPWSCKPRPPAPELSQPPRSHANTKRQLAAMGRLDYQKGFDLLIDAFARAAEGQPDWSLVILGEGPERRRLEEQIHTRGLEPRVQLLGWVSDPSRVLRDCDAFVLSSRYEGFPNALLEAMALGLPAVAVDCPSGPADIIRSEVDGLLVPLGSVPALTTALRRLMCDEKLRHRLGREAVQVVGRFSSERYYARWEAVLRHDPPSSLE